MIWLTSDWHLGHENIIKYCDRPFNSAAEMNSVLLSNALEVVAPSDTLYVLGDFAFDRRVFEAYAASLDSACNVGFVQGNHDAKQAVFDYGLASDFRHNHRHYYVCHYPWATWRPNTVMVHGHCHGKTVPLPADSRQQWRYDVGVDVDWTKYGVERYYPVPITAIEKRIEGI